MILNLPFNPAGKSFSTPNDPDLEAYWNDIALATRAPLFAAGRLGAIARILRGRFDPGRAAVAPVLWTPRAALRLSARLVAAGVCFVVGASLTVLIDSTWGLALGVVVLLAAPTVAFAPLAAPPATQERNGG